LRQLEKVGEKADVLVGGTTETAADCGLPAVSLDGA